MAPRQRREKDVVHITARVTNVGRKEGVRSGDLPFRTNASTLPITPRRPSSRDVGTSSYRYHTATGLMLVNFVRAQSFRLVWCGSLTRGVNSSVVLVTTWFQLTTSVANSSQNAIINSDSIIYDNYCTLFKKVEEIVEQKKLNI
ncbi:hypothetical protein TNCV_1511081 [Trichonephila clavipes]|nr:hypothetical protein TNCV_1511081 [Trichonephila clavipes]